MHRNLLTVMSCLIAFAWACSDAKCPPPFMQFGKVCRLCPPGEDREQGRCVPIRDATADTITEDTDAGANEPDNLPEPDPDDIGGDDVDVPEPDAEAEADPPCNDGGAGTCVQCNSATDCSNPVGPCQERVCSPTGSCGVRTKTGDTCPTPGDCDGSDQCVECIDSSTCPASLPYCADGICRQCMDDGNCGSARLECKNHMCVNRCGNGLIERTVDEDCEVGVSGWTSANCLLCKESVYAPSATTTCKPNASEIMALHFFGPGDCPSIPSFTPTCLNIGGLGCYLSCNSDANCPARYRCSPFAGTALEGWNPPFAGYCR